MKFWVEYHASPHKQATASHFINVERRLKQQTEYLGKLRDQGVIVDGPYAVLNASVARFAALVETESWESLSQIFHDDPMAIYQEPQVSYLSDFEGAMHKHAESIGSDATRADLEQDVRVDLGLDLVRD